MSFGLSFVSCLQYWYTFEHKLNIWECRKWGREREGRKEGGRENKRGRNEEEVWFCNESWAAASEMNHKHIRGMLHMQVLACLYTHPRQGNTHTHTHSSRWSGSCGVESRWWGGLSNSGTHKHTHQLSNDSQCVSVDTCGVTGGQKGEAAAAGAVTQLRRAAACTRGRFQCVDVAERRAHRDSVKLFSHLEIKRGSVK